MGHIELSRDRDLILIAPASADFMAKLAHGYADDLLSTLCVARRCPLMVAPAMNVEMWQNAATTRNARDASRRWRGRSSGQLLAARRAARWAWVA
jgi:phosphopantothenoylcysteine decarboxylase/phosphopantothenate--cysteine ligase